MVIVSIFFISFHPPSQINFSSFSLPPFRSVDKRVSQILNGHTGTFATIKIPGRVEPAQVLCFEEKKVDSPAKLYVMEVGRDKDAPGGVFRLAPQQIPNAVDAPNDFPVAMQVSCSSRLRNG